MGVSPMVGAPAGMSGGVKGVGGSLGAPGLSANASLIRSHSPHSSSAGIRHCRIGTRCAEVARPPE
jgi:hypothetical protein